MFCKDCGKEISDKAVICPNCGVDVNGGVKSKKSKTAAALLAFFLGGLGIHRFYVGKIGTGIVMIVCWIFIVVTPIWALIDFIMILCGKFTDSDGNLLS